MVVYLFEQQDQPCIFYTDWQEITHGKSFVENGGNRYDTPRDKGNKINTCELVKDL